MALIKGVNCGFVTIAPTDDPTGFTNGLVDNYSMAWKNTAPTGAIKVIEIGWWCNNETEAADFEVGIYGDNGSGTAPNLLIGKSVATAKGTTIGWKKVSGLNIAITAGTIYWIAQQLDDTTTQTITDLGAATELWNYKAGTTELESPWDGEDTGSRIRAIYALIDIGNTAADDFNNGPLADLGVTVSRTPVTVTTNFGGQKTYTDGSVAGITAIFVNPSKNFALDKSGLTEVFDAKLIVASTQTINKHDKITYDSKTYRVDKVNNRIRAGTTAFKSVILFFID